MPPTATAFARPTVLVVDDDPGSITLVSAALRSSCEVRVATSGLKALTIIGSDEPPDLILLAVVMPGIGGLDLCRKLQGSRARRDIPIIFMSSLSDAEDECRGLAVGAVDYLRKPINPSVIRARVQLHLDIKHARDVLTQRIEVLEAKASEQITRQFRHSGPRPGLIHPLDGSTPPESEPLLSEPSARRA